MNTIQPFEQLELEYSLWLKSNDDTITSENCVSVSSGTSALHIACEVLRWSMGGEPLNIVVPEYTMVACARAVTLSGNNLLLADCLTDLTLDPETLPAQYDAVMPVHVYGLVCRMNALASKGKPMIEDMAEAHGVYPHKESFAACWSFYKNKIVYGEEGGMIWFKSREHAAYARMLRSVGFTSAHNYTHVPRGINARMSNLHAAAILPSLRDIKSNLMRRWYLWNLYCKLLCGIDAGYRMSPASYPTVPWVFAMHVQDMTFEQQEQVVHKLKQKGIAARHGFKPMSSQPEYQHLRRNNTDVSRAYAAASEVFYLPLSETMLVGEVLSICDDVKIIVKAVLTP